MSAPLVAEDVTFRVGPHVLVDQARLTVDAGELVAIVGPNGAGKTTLCRLLAAEARPTEGRVVLHGRPVDRWSGRELARRRAVLPQRPATTGTFTAIELVLMGRHPWLRRAGAVGPVDYDLAGEAMVEAGVEHLAARSFPTLSGGEQARVHLARVLAQTTPVLVLDEPTASLDLRHQHLVAAIARRRAHAGVAVVMVVHDVGLAAAYADRVVALGGGRVVADGRPAEVLTPDRLSALYGHPVAVGTHPSQAWTLPAAERVEGGRVDESVLGIPNYF